MDSAELRNFAEGRDIISQPQGQRNSKHECLLPFGNPALILHELTYLYDIICTSICQYALAQIQHIA